MGLLGNVTSEEMEEALKPPKPFEAGAYDFVVTKASPRVTKQGGEHPYIPLELTIEDGNGQTRKAYQNVSLSPKARNLAIQFFAALGLDPNDVEDETQLQGLRGRGWFKVGKTNKGTERNEFARPVVAAAE